MKFITFISTLACLILVSSITNAAAPEMINYQGRLTDTGGNPVGDSLHTVTFTIYDAAIGGTSKWTETQSVNTSDGLFAVLLGSINPINDSVFKESPRYLGIQVGVDPEISPRTMLVTIPWSFRVNTVDGAIGGEILTKVSIGPGNINTGAEGFVAGRNNRVRGDYSVVGGGGGAAAADSNAALGIYATIGGGQSNVISSTTPFGTIGGGQENIASKDYATIAGGYSDTASGFAAVVGGGSYNIASGQNATVAGGTSNSASGWVASIGGGDINKAIGDYSSISGGVFNIASGHYSNIAGGGNNVATDSFTTISGGYKDTASGYAATVGGGYFNNSSADYSTIGGGDHNKINEKWSFIGGGRFDTINGGYGTIGGGRLNKINGEYSFIGGGDSHTSSGHASTIGGGELNTAGGIYSFVGGGASNTASGEASVACGGVQAAASGDYSVIGGGFVDSAKGISATVGGGSFNVASGKFATIPGGISNTAAGDYSLAAGRRANANHRGTFVWADSTNADFASSGGNQFLIRASGGVGIGTNVPLAGIHVKGPSWPKSFAYFDTDTSGQDAGLRFNESGVAKSHLYHQAITNTLNLYGEGFSGISITSTGSVGIGTTLPSQKLHVVGNICATGTIGACSDARYKSHIRPLQSALDKVKNMRGVIYKWDRESFPQFAEGNQIGFLAQEIKEVLPEVVSEGSDGMLSIDYGRFSVVLVEAIKEQQKKIEILEKKLNELENKSQMTD